MLTKARDNTLSSAVVVAGWEGAGLVLFFFLVAFISIVPVSAK